MGKISEALDEIVKGYRAFDVEDNGLKKILAYIGSEDNLSEDERKIFEIKEIYLSSRSKLNYRLLLKNNYDSRDYDEGMWGILNNVAIFNLNET